MALRSSLSHLYILRGMHNQFIYDGMSVMDSIMKMTRQAILDNCFINIHLNDIFYPRDFQDNFLKYIEKHPLVDEMSYINVSTFLKNLEGSFVSYKRGFNFNITPRDELYSNNCYFPLEFLLLARSVIKTLKSRYLEMDGYSKSWLNHKNYILKCVLDSIEKNQEDQIILNMDRYIAWVILPVIEVILALLLYLSFTLNQIKGIGRNLYSHAYTYHISFEGMLKFYINELQLEIPLDILDYVCKSFQKHFLEDREISASDYMSVISVKNFFCSDLYSFHYDLKRIYDNEILCMLIMDECSPFYNLPVELNMIIREYLC